MTTNDETEAYYIVRAILREVVNVRRVIMRDLQTYCGVLLDDSNRKTLCRFYFNTGQKYIGFLEDGQLERIPIESLDDIYKHVDRLKAVVSRLEIKAPVPKQKSKTISQELG